MNLDNFQDILIVDNEESELNDLALIFKEELNCQVKTHLYEQSEEPDNPFDNVRLVFFDLNITPDELRSEDANDINWETNRNISTAFNGLQVALTDVIDINNRPYALIFWTKHAEYIESFKDYVSKRPNKGLASPVYIGCLDKIVFEASDNKACLIHKELKNTVFYKLMEFEKLLNNEVQSMMYNILDIANEDNMSIWNNTYQSNLQSFLRTISSHHAGFEHAKNNPTKSLTEALLPILTDKIIKNTENTQIWDDILDFQSANKKDCVFSDNNNIPKLNSIFHISDKPVETNTRGATFNISNLQPGIEKAYNFCFIDIFKKMLPNLHDKNCYKNIQEATRIQEVQYIATEISSACDYSQVKSRINKYIFGLMIPAQVIDSLKKPTKHFSQGSDSTLLLSSRFRIKNTDYCFAYNYNFVFTLNSLFLQEHIFTFNKEIMDFIGNRYSNHVSRIGITSF